MNVFEWLPKWFILMIISLLIGGLIGLEQESYHKSEENKHFGGIRTFPLISLLGFSSFYFIDSVIFQSVVFFSFSLLILSGYIYEAIYFKRKGITTEVAGILTFILGAITANGFYTESIFVAVTVTLILSLREHIHSFVYKYIDEKDIIAVLKFLIVSVVLYPLLPNHSYTALKLNPKSIWLMVILISSISFTAYFATKIFGSKRGILLTSLFGGLISSTALTLAFAKRSKETPELSKELSFGIVLASTIMFIRQFFVLLFINYEVALKFSIFAILLFFLGLALIFGKASKEKRSVPINFANPYELSYAFYFGAFYALILALSRLAHSYFGSFGVYALGLISGAADVDPITISMAQLAKSGSLDLNVTIITIMIASITNTAIKGIFAAFFGSKELSINVWKSFWIIIVAGISIMILFRYI
jgi:uncharacterized membrane protein (DUF4010 family)